MTTLTQRMNVVEENLQSIRLTLDTLLQNLLNPALMVPGTLRFGGNTMQLDQHGIQIDTAGADIPAVFFVDGMSNTPTTDQPRAYLQGNTDRSLGEASISSFAISSDATDFLAQTSSTATTAEADAYIRALASNGTIARIGAETDGSTKAYASLQGALQLRTSTLTPTQITSNTDDYAPSNLFKSSILRLSSDASRDITGITGGAGGRILFIFNVGGFNIVLKNDVTSTAANRFLFPADITLAPNDGIGLMYDSTSSRWRCFGRY